MMAFDIGSSGVKPAPQFDEFVASNGVVVTPADRFEELAVSVLLPPDWEPFHEPPLDSTTGTRAWNWVADPLITQFGANAVLSMSRVNASLDPAEVFAMLCKWQVHMVEGSRERHRGLEPAHEGPGHKGVLVMEIPTDFGLIGSESLTRIIRTESQTLIAQLTITARCDSPVDASQIGLIVTPAESAGSASEARRGGEPVGYSGGASTPTSRRDQ